MFKAILKFCTILAIIAAVVASGLTMPVTVHAQSQDPIMVRVGLTRSFANRDQISVTNTSIIAGYGIGGAFVPSRELNSPGGFTVRVDGGRVVLASGAQVVYTFNAGNAPQIMGTHGEFVGLGASTFRGVIEFLVTGRLLTAVNVLSIEEYLYGVVPQEMYPTFHIEALKAQAVAARTFTYNQIRDGRHAAQGFDLCDSTHCQVYQGANTEHEATTRAVHETSGLMLFHEGETILAVYFSSSGGATDNSEDVWFEALPYLRSVNEIAEHEPMIWTRTFTWQELTTAAQNAGANIGMVNGASVSRKSASGRVAELTLHGANGNWTLRRESIRHFFAPIGGSLHSNNFRIVGAAHTTIGVNTSDGESDRFAPLGHLQALDHRGAISQVHMAYIFDGETMRRVNSIPIVARGGSGITLEGRGWGHGLGMSQRGAEGMARLGYTFIAILTHYYTGVEVR